MAAPVYANRTTAFVGKFGSDDAGLNIVGAPQARLTIAQALADIAAGYNAATPTAPKVISLEPGVYTTPAFALPPNIFIEADPDAQGGSDGEVVILLTGNITLAAGWSANATAIGGFRGVTIRAEATQTIDLTMPVPASGNPVRKIYLRDVTTNVDSLSWEATSSADILRVDDVIHDGNSGDAIEFSGGTQIINGLESAAIPLLNDTASLAAAIQAYRIFITSAGGGVIYSATGGGVTARMGSSDCRALTLNRTGAITLAVSADAISIPLTANVTYTGTATSANLIPTTDGGGISPVFPVGYFGNGSAAAPSITFINDTDTGIYLFGANKLGFAVGGALAFYAESDGSAGVRIRGLTSYLGLSAAGTVDLIAGGTNQNVSMTPSGTGRTVCNSTVDNVALRVTENGTRTLDFSVTSGAQALIASNVTQQFSASTNKYLFSTGGVDSGALLQIGTNTTTAAGGAVFGTDSFFYRLAPGVLALDINSGSMGYYGRVAGTTQLALQFTGVQTELISSASALVLKANNAAALTMTVAQLVIKNVDTFLNRAAVAMANGAAAAVGTLTNAPAAGDPTKWLAVDDNGTTRYVPAW